MNSLSFNHFRKFEKFPKIDFGDILFLVGANNSGKSSFLKANMLFQNYFESPDVRQFALNLHESSDTKLVNYQRTFNNHIKDKKNKDFIDFTFNTPHYDFHINISGKDETVVADVHEFKIFHRATNVSVQLFPSRNNYKLEIKPPSDLIDEDIDIYLNLKKRHDELSNELQNGDFEPPLLNNSAYLELKNNVDKINGQLKIFENSNKHKKALYRKEGHFDGKSILEIIKALYLVTTFDINKDINKQRQWVKKSFQNFLSLFTEFIEQRNFHFISASVNKQSVLFLKDDKANLLAQSIHEFYNANYKISPKSRIFVNKWLKKFEIGDELEIKSIEDEAYTVNIKNGDETTALADFGRGSIHLAKLIINIASIISKNNINTTIFIEEPEINLHPKLQSELCNFFYDVYEEYKIKFIIETHSEYIIRKSQLLVKEYGLEKDVNYNPFSVLYFNEDRKVWSMIYREDGKFKNEFGTGFFDESTNLAFDLM